MGLKVILTARALDDLREIVEYVAADNLERACSFGEELIDRALSVGEFPQAGRMAPETADPKVREVLLGAYRIVYEVYPERGIVFILRFWHSVRGQPEIPL